MAVTVISAKLITSECTCWLSAASATKAISAQQLHFLLSVCFWTMDLHVQAAFVWLGRDLTKWLAHIEPVISEHLAIHLYDVQIRPLQLEPSEKVPARSQLFSKHRMSSSRVWLDPNT